MKKQHWLVLPFLLWLALTVQNVQADEGQWKTYTVADGLVSPEVTTIFQDRIGRLWFGARAGGVSRFDGEHFRSFTKKDGLPDGSIKQILEDKRGQLWFIITPSPMPWEAALVCRYDGKTFQRITEPDGLPKGVSEAALKDKSGNLWLANKYGLTKYDGKKFQHFGGKEFQNFIAVQSGADGKIQAIFESRNGDIWLGGGPGIRRREGPNREPQPSRPFAIRYDGKKFDYFPLKSWSGFPPPAIYAIAEDEAGNLWLGGRFALFKYAGKRFERFDSDSEKQPTTQTDLTTKVGPGEVLLTWQEPSSSTAEPRYRHRKALISIDSIFKDRQGHLWFNNRGFISRWDGKKLEHFLISENWGETKEQIRLDKLDKNESPSFYPGPVVLEDTQGKLWFKSPNGAHRFNGDGFQTFRVDDGLGSDNISAILETMDGKFWFGHDNGVTVFDPSPPVIQNFMPRGALGSNSVRFIHEAKPGSIWFSVRGGLARYDGEKMQYFSEKQMSEMSHWKPSLPLPLDPNFSLNILDGGKGSLWFVGADLMRQIFRYKDRAFQRYSLRNDGARPIAIDRYNYRPRRFEALENRLLTVDSAGNLWFAVGNSPIRWDGKSFRWLTANGFQVVAPNGRNGRISIPDGRADRRRITDIQVDTQGNIWLATSHEGVKRYDGVSLKTLTTADGLKSNHIRKIFEDREKNLWFVSELPPPDVSASPSQQVVYVSRYDGLSIQNFSIEPMQLYGPMRIDIHQDTRGILWFVGSQLGICKYDGSNFDRVLTPDNSVAAMIAGEGLRASIVDRSGNLWLATSHGVIKYDGKRFTTYTIEDGLLVNDIRDVFEDSQGNLWCATWGGGVALYNGETFQAITTKHGLVHNNVRSLFEDRRGNMWFATDGGITKYTLRTDILPRIKLTKFIANDVYTEFDNELQLPAKVRRLVFEYRGISLQRLKLLYTYKLEGYEADWSQPSLKNRVEYDGLKPGSYTFLVKALHQVSPYSNPPAVLRFTIAPPFWTQSQFYLSTSLGVVTLAAFVFLIARLIVQWRRAAALRAELRQKEDTDIQRVKKELNDAREMQMGLLPKAAPHIDEFELAGASLPAAEVGGDFYEYLTLRENGKNLVGITLADVSGKGLRGAMNAVMTNGMLHEIVQIESKVGAILSRLNTDLSSRLYGSMFTALNLGILNPQTKQIYYANAGQRYPIIKRRQEVKEVELSGLPLGLIADAAYDEETVDLHSGDFVIFYTDGLIEAMNVDEEIYGSERLKDVIREASANLSAAEMISHILQDVQAFAGEAEQYDDITLVVLRHIEDRSISDGAEIIGLKP